MNCKDCIYWGSTLSPEDRAEAARNIHTDLVCDLWDSDGFSPLDYCSQGEAIKPKLIDMVENAPTINEWISVMEREPEDSGLYMTSRPSLFTNGGIIETLHYGRIDKRKQKFWWRYDSEYGDVVVDGVTHWMPLPEPPEVRAGVPDLFLPVARGQFHGLWIEMKRQRGGRVTDEQKWWIDRLRRQGYAAEVCKGAGQAIELITRYLELTTENEKKGTE